MARKNTFITLAMLAIALTSCNERYQKKEIVKTAQNETIMKQFTKKNLYWTNEPKQYSISDSIITIVTEPNTDLWQRTYYGFQNDNADRKSVV